MAQARGQPQRAFSATVFCSEAVSLNTETRGGGAAGTGDGAP